MYAKAEKTKENKTKATANCIVQEKSNRQNIGVIDNRPEKIVQRKMENLANNGSNVKLLETVQKTENKITIPSQSKSKKLIELPFQRMVARVGYNEDQASSWNPFIKQSHIAVKNMADKIALTKPTERLDDYDRESGDLKTVKTGIVGDTLHVVGHGQPGKIAGVDSGTLANNIKTSLGTGASNIGTVKLHSCFSNIAEPGGVSSGKSFNEKFQKPTEAASGILYGDTGTVLPPRYTSFKYAAKATSEYIHTNNTWLKDENELTRLAYENEIKKMFKLIDQCTQPLEKFLKETFVKYKGLDPAGEKTINNENNVFNFWLALGIDLDAIPKRDYPTKLDSVSKGLANTYSMARSDLELALENKKISQDRYDRILGELNVAYNNCFVAYNELITKGL